MELLPGLWTEPRRGHFNSWLAFCPWKVCFGPWHRMGEQREREDAALLVSSEATAKFSTGL